MSSVAIVWSYTTDELVRAALGGFRVSMPPVTNLVQIP
jgi:hypothetical protein